MPRCNSCGNDKHFIVTYLEFEKVTYEGDRIIDQFAGDRERADYWITDKYLPECFECDSTDIEGGI